ncbi:uncharacterized protein GGS25DRAFT_473513 [Hypoxylon fragiforme]|uniref:uncharacterized protein n=1 Tax=Hypoxylon fragiforme TaxID=63214 RepID=UPI0020C741FF|nr:uncharacterized protein GGS25DRAFT_473513 [Hypoxylon fragiforme]KAI2612030.1 hypothetical protein GGS25DRAFT_473513 [Hypoxylon fragiforme]
MSRRNDFAGYTPQPTNPGAQQHQPHGQQHHQQLSQHQQHQNQPHQQPHGPHAQHPHHQPHQQSHQAQQHHATPVPPPMTIPQPAVATSQQSTPTPAPAPAPPRGRKRAAPGHQQPHASAPNASTPVPAVSSAAAPTSSTPAPAPAATPVSAAPQPPMQVTPVIPPAVPTKEEASTPSVQPPAKKSRTNTPWTPAEELRLKQMRDAGNSWAEIAKTFPTRTEGSVKKHWYKDMHYAEFAEDESQALLSAIKDYENNKWKTIGQKVGKPAKACEQYAKEHFPDLFAPQKARYPLQALRVLFSFLPVPHSCHC